MSDNPPPEENLADEFRRLGMNLISALQAAWESPERKRFQDEMARGLSDIGETISREAEKLTNSPTGKQVKTEVEELGERIRNVEMQEKVRTDILEALKTANSEIQKVIERWSEADTATKSGESGPPNQPSA